MEYEEQSVSSTYIFVRGRQLEGTYLQGREVGIWGVTAMRVMRGWGVVEEVDWPYVVGSWPPQEPVGIDVLAKKSRILAYQRVRNVEECKWALARGCLVSATFKVTKQWYKAVAGIIEEPSPNDSFEGNHGVRLVGYDDSNERLRFANSWGVEWGNQGFGSLSYSYFDRYFLEAWIINYSMFPSLMKEKGILERDWGIQDLVAKVLPVEELYEASPGVLHGVEIYNAEIDECVGWAFAVCRDGFLDVEELFVRPAFRRAGYGSRLARMLNELAGYLGLPLRLWVSYADWKEDNKIGLEKIIRRLSLRLVSSNVRWAAMESIPMSGPSVVK